MLAAENVFVFVLLLVKHQHTEQIKNLTMIVLDEKLRQVTECLYCHAQISFVISWHPSGTSDPAQSTHSSCRRPSYAKPCSLHSHCFSMHLFFSSQCLLFALFVWHLLFTSSFCDLQRGKKSGRLSGVTYIIFTQGAFNFKQERLGISKNSISCCN